MRRCCRSPGGCRSRSAPPAGRARAAPAPAPARQGRPRRAVIAERSTSSRSRRPWRRPPPARGERQGEGFREFLAHAGGELGGHVHGEPVLAPIGDDAVRLHAAMRLHLRAVFAVDDDIGCRKTRGDIAARSAPIGPAHIALLRQPARRRACRRRSWRRCTGPGTPAARRACGHRPCRRRRAAARYSTLIRSQRGIRGRRRDRGDGSDGCADIEHAGAQCRPPLVDRVVRLSRR